MSNVGFCSLDRILSDSGDGTVAAMPVGGGVGDSGGENGGTAGSSSPTRTLRKAMLQRMKSLTMAEEDVCEEFLEQNNYNLEQAVGEFYK